MGNGEAQIVVLFSRTCQHKLCNDPELSLMNAMEVMFQNLTQLLCIFHTSKNVKMKYTEYVKSERQEHAIDLQNNIMYSNRETEFKKHLKHCQIVCVNITLLVNYVNDTWLTPYKEKYVVVWTIHITHLENTTTNRYMFLTLHINV